MDDKDRALVAVIRARLPDLAASDVDMAKDVADCLAMFESYFANSQPQPEVDLFEEAIPF